MFSEMTIEIVGYEDNNWTDENKVGWDYVQVCPIIYFSEFSKLNLFSQPLIMFKCYFVESLLITNLPHLSQALLRLLPCKWNRAIFSFTITVTHG